MTSASAGRYRLEAHNAAGVSSAEIVLEVLPAVLRQGAITGGSGTGVNGGGGTVTVGTVSARWWVYDVESALEGGTLGLPAFWIHDRVLQRSAWVTRNEAHGATRVSAWAAEDQQVVQVVSSAGVAWEVTALRALDIHGAQWEGFELAGAWETQVLPERLSGVYEAGVADASYPVSLRWNPARTESLAWYADWEALLPALEEGEVKWVNAASNGD